MNVAVTLCFVTQGCAGLRILVVFCDSGLRWFACSFCVLQFRVALVCVFFLCFAPRLRINSFCVFCIQRCAGLRILIVFWDSGLRCARLRSNYVVYYFLVTSTE